MKEKNITLKPYDYDVQNDVYTTLFCNMPYETENGCTEIPAASYQLVVSALECILWDVYGKDRDVIKQACGIVSYLRDAQKMREYNRNREEKA